MRALVAGADAIVIVDVLSFCTCVDVAVGRGAPVFPYPWKDESARAFAESRGALLAGGRGTDALYSLSPKSLLSIPESASLVLPSPNGAALSALAGESGKPTFAGCLRNARAVAEAA